MKLIEFRSGEKVESLKVILQRYFEKNLKDDSFDSFSLNPVVYVTDRKIKDFSYKVKAKAKIVLVIDDGKECAPLKVAFENKELVVFDKPYGLSTQGTLKRHEDNLYDQARLHYIKEKNFPSGLPYVGLHHRLDRDTSGLVLMTKMRSANKEISDLFKERKIKKSYIAFVEYGEKSFPKKWTCKAKIQRGFSKRHPFIFKVNDEGDEAITEFEVIKSVSPNYHILKCFPKTGRTHQLRVHLSYQGLPILGDRVYGRKKTALRLMLHAQELSFSFSGSEIRVLSSLDQEDLMSFLPEL